jgi:hypothetical protein
LFPAEAQQAPPVYFAKGYEFVPGEGDTRDWIQDENTVIYGGRGELVFCKSYTWQELKDLDFTLAITRNIPPGIYDSPSGPCPEDSPQEVAND